MKIINKMKNGSGSETNWERGNGERGRGRGGQQH